jgi:hypothetical protein
MHCGHPPVRRLPAETGCGGAMPGAPGRTRAASHALRITHRIHSQCLTVRDAPWQVWKEPYPSPTSTHHARRSPGSDRHHHAVPCPVFLSSWCETASSEPSVVLTTEDLHYRKHVLDAAIITAHLQASRGEDAGSLAMLDDLAASSGSCALPSYAPRAGACSARSPSTRPGCSMAMARLCMTQPEDTL